MVSAYTSPLILALIVDALGVIAVCQLQEQSWGSVYNPPPLPYSDIIYSLRQVNVWSFMLFDSRTDEFESGEAIRGTNYHVVVQVFRFITS